MANTTAKDKSNNDEFDEDLELDDDFIDDFAQTPDAQKDGLGAPIRLERAGSAPTNVKTLINLLVIGTVTLALVYFGYSYYKKAHSPAHKKDLLPNNMQTPAEHQHTATHEKPIELNNPSMNQEGSTPSIANSKIEDLQFELTSPTGTDNKTKEQTVQHSNQNHDAKGLADNGKIEGLDQALAPATKVLKPVEDLFDSNVADNNKTTTNLPHANDSKSNDYIKDTLASMAEEITLNVNHIQQLESTVSQINKTLEQLTQALTKLDSKLSDVTSALSAMDQDVNNIKKVISNQDLDLASMPNKISSSKRDPLVYSTPDYVVHAIIPGRAWLKSTSGQIITITEGDSLGDFGKVASIDATNNLVRTSSGITFR